MGLRVYFIYHGMMKKRDLFIIIYTIIVLLSVMYATQPLQPLLANEFNISMSEASYFTAVVMFFLAIAPIFYGYVLERVCAKRVLYRSSLVLFITNILLGFSTSYEMFLLIRIVESLIIPAILTSTMSILANMDKDNIQFNMSIYVASTVFGGLIGRVLSGFIATYFGWQAVFFSLSFALLIGLFFVHKLQFEGDTNLTKGNLKDVLTILSDRRYVLVYALMFIMFFVFAGLLNVLPFRSKELISDVNESTIGLLYLGYGTGIVVALYSKKIVSYFGSKIKTILFSLSFYIGVTIFLYSSNLIFIFALLFLFCMGMFTIHSVSSGLANSMKESQKSLTSGMYLSFYYIGGAIGSIIPVFIYEQYGWNTMLTLFIVLLLSIFCILFLNRKTIK